MTPTLYRWRCEVRDHVDHFSIAKFVRAATLADATILARRIYGRIIVSLSNDGAVLE